MVYCIKNENGVKLAGGLTLEEAQEKMLELFNELTGYETASWEEACELTKDRVFGAHSNQDGLWSFEEDGGRFSVEEEIVRSYLYDKDGYLYASSED